MDALTTIWNGLDWSVLTDILLSVIPALVCITLHELSHGFVAYKLGDNTAKNAGRLTLNPIRHIDVWGLVCMVLFKFGWAKPVPVNMRNFQNPKRGMALTALAGPVCNFIIAVVFLFLYGLLWPLYLRGSAVMTIIVQMVITTAYLSLALAVFNLLPIPPLDGSKVLYSFLNDRAYEKLMRYEKYGMIIMVVLVATGAVSGVLSTVTGWVYDKLFIFAEFGYNLVSR
ncbi:MAG: site-2 protease family protein [Oscillospiraceae bacterium]|nr:site-2 protease family protein [Oscillospiraceae bacterium]